MITKEQILKALEAGKTVSVGAWSFTEKYMCCWHEGCCDTHYDSLDEAVRAIVYYSSKNDLSDVDLD